MSADRSREQSLDPGSFGVRWFEVYTAWTEVDDSQERVNSYCVAKACVWDGERKKWIATDIPMEVWAPGSDSLPSTGSKLRAVWMNESSRWELLSNVTTRLAITVSNDGSYPSAPATVYPISFLDSASFPRVAGLQVASKTYGASVDDYGFNLTGDYLEQGTVVLVAEVFGQQWIEQAYGSTAPIRFRLVADLALGGHADAKILTWNGSSWVLGTNTIAVYDWMNTLPEVIRTGMFRAYENYEGWAIFRAAADPSETPTPRDKYDIVWLEHKALFVRFTLTAPITNQNTATAVTYSGDTFFQGRDPNAGTGSGVISVYDVEGMFLHAPAGAEGLAVYNDTNDHYEIVLCQMPVLKATANLAAPMCGPSAVAIENFSAVVDGLFMLTPDPVPSSVLNPLRRKGISGALVKIEHDLAAGTWSVYGVETQEFFLGGPVTITNGELIQDIYSVAAESCIEGAATQNIIGETTDCDYVPYTPGGGGSGGDGDPGTADPTSTYFDSGFDLSTAPGWSSDPEWTSSDSFAQTTGAGIGIERQPSCGSGSLCFYQADLTVEIGPEGGFLEYSWSPGPGLVCAAENESADFNVNINGVHINGGGGACGLIGPDTGWRTRGPYTLQPGTNVITFSYSEYFNGAPSGSGLAFKIADLTIWGEVTP